MVDNLSLGQSKMRLRDDTPLSNREVQAILLRLAREVEDRESENQKLSRDIDALRAQVNSLRR